ncbi:hypothetical protein TKK_0006150 [Trichogramma kaykai]
MFKYWKTNYFLCFFLALTSVKAQLVHEAKIYHLIAEAVHNVFNNTCLIFMYTVENPMRNLGLHESQDLVSLPIYMGRLHVRTTAYAIKTFRQQIGESYYSLKRPLFILINDSDELREQYSTLIAPWIDMAYINWVIFFRSNTSIPDFFSNIHVPLDCVFLVVQKFEDSRTYVLTEVYSIDKGRELITNVFGTWEEESGLEITRLALYQRRSNLQGQLIRVTTVEDPPVSVAIENSDGTMTGIKGFFGTIIQILEENLNCTIVYSKSEAWGSKHPDGSWSGAIGMLVRKETDLVAAELLMSTDRLDSIAFTTPVFSTKCRTFIKRPQYAAVKWTAYSDPFYGGIWLCILIIMLLSSGFILISFKTSPSRFQFSSEELDVHFLDTFFHIFGDVCSQGSVEVDIDPIRMIHLVIHFTGVILVAAYSAALISFLAVKVFVMPFTTMLGLLEDGSYKFGVVKDSADYGFFQTTSDKVLQRMFSEILDDVEKLPNNYLEGLSKVCTEKDYAFMTTDNMFAILEHLMTCILEPLEPIMQTTLAMGVQKRSPFRGIINSNILMMGDSGVLQRVIATELAIQGSKGGENLSAVEIIDILPLMLLIIGGVFFATMIMLLEKLHHSQFAHQLKASLAQKLRQPNRLEFD